MNLAPPVATQNIAHPEEPPAHSSRSWRVRVLTATYRNLDNQGSLEPVIHLFGRTETGQSITVRYPGFRPYFYIVKPSSQTLETANANRDITGTESVRLWHSGADQDCLKVFTRTPGVVPALRTLFQTQGQTVLAADIPFAHRFFYDLDLGACVEVEGTLIRDPKEASSFTTDLVVEADSISDTHPFKIPLKVLSFDLENSLHDEHIYCLCLVVRQPDGSHSAQQLYGTEVEIIQDFMDAVREHDPDILTGYNIDGFDLPVLERRSRATRSGPMMLGRDGSVASQASNRIWRVSGRVVADAWWNVRREVRPKRESLGAVSRQLLGRSKHDVDPRRMDSEWASNRQRVLDYCQEDAQLALELLEHIRVLDKYQDLATVAKLPLDDVMNGRTSTMIDSLMIRAADHAGVGVPLTRHQQRTGHIEGGYVHTLRPGLYHWVCVLDFKSMYPSVIIANNLCFTTLDPTGKGEIVSPTGIHFLSPAEREGLLPGLLRNLMKDRDAAKESMKAAGTDEERAYYNGLQEAIKILMNSVYGVFASYFYRFTNLDIGASITAWARRNITNIISELEREAIKVIYSDTDSIFVASPQADLEGTVTFGRGLAQRYSKIDAQLEFEKVLEPFFSHGAKKRYVGRIVWPEPGTIVRGYETRRSDAFTFQTQALNAIFSKILDADTEGALQLAREQVPHLNEGRVPVVDLVISKGVGNMSQYKDPDSLPQVQALRKYQATGREVVPGMKVSFVVTDGSRTPMQVEPFIDDEDPPHPDLRYYAGRIARSMARVTEVFGWTETDLLLGSQQATLFDGFTHSGTTRNKDLADASTSKSKPTKPRQQKLF